MCLSAPLAREGLFRKLVKGYKLQAKNLKMGNSQPETCNLQLSLSYITGCAQEHEHLLNKPNLVDTNIHSRFKSAMQNFKALSYSGPTSIILLWTLSYL
jgi:hypothetical protein